MSNLVIVVLAAVVFHGVTGKKLGDVVGMFDCLIVMGLAIAFDALRLVVLAYGDIRRWQA